MTPTTTTLRLCAAARAALFLLPLCARAGNGIERIEPPSWWDDLGLYKMAIAYVLTMRGVPQLY